MNKVIKIVVDGVVSAPELEQESCSGCCFRRNDDDNVSCAKHYREVDGFVFGNDCRTNRIIFVPDVSTEKKFTVKEVIDTIVDLGYVVRFTDHSKFCDLDLVVSVVESTLLKKNEPGYQEYLRLKAIYGDLK
jgi:hypothetical protein